MSETWGILSLEMFRTTKDMIWRRRRAACLVAAALVMGAASGSASDTTAATGARSAEAAQQVADRTLVPRRIRLIIGWKRPRLA